ncbi:MAG: phosphatidylserine/phosphatidylglycerophosphate/cardiolipin synthase family protein [Bdellovibrionales bacterium]|nr:phosphatidylserine/phosphatidylglycerophosphate/cardiolipin synthase family protein [Bdellovibrionales bacterium]
MIPDIIPSLALQTCPGAVVRNSFLAKAAFAGLLLLFPHRGFSDKDSSIAVLNDPIESISATMDMIDSATESIDVMYYQIKEDKFAALFVKRLIQARLRNVKVRIIYDAYESKITPETISIFNLAGIETRVFHSYSQLWPGRIHTVLNKRMHDKLLIVDRKRMKIGDRNVGDTYYDLRAGARFQFVSTEYIITGQSAVSATKTFNEFWDSQEVTPSAGSEDRLLIRQRDGSIEELSKEVPLISWAPNFLKLEKAPVFFSDPPTRSVGPGPTAKFILKAIENAKHSLIIESPFVILTDEFKNAISLAIQRGVRVTVLTNGKGSIDEPPAEKAYSYGRRDLIAMGIELRERRIPGRNFHQKTFVIDGKHTILTSFNMDPRSQNLSTESGVLISDVNFATSVLQRIESYKKFTVEVHSISSKGQKLLSGDGKVVKTYGDVCSGLVSRTKSWLLRPLL